MEKVLFLLRGLPGAGKSTLAKSLGSVYFEADMFYMEGNEYKFDIKKIGKAHDWCKEQVRISMANSSSRLGDTRIAVANTFTQEWEMIPYYEMAKEYGFKVFSLIVENRHDGVNVHDCPDDVLDNMHKRFEFKLI